jgi:hypothetical protein
LSGMPEDGCSTVSGSRGPRVRTGWEAVTRSGGMNDAGVPATDGFASNRLLCSLVRKGRAT